MNELHELKEMLCKELKEYGSKGELSAGSLATIDTLAHAVKNLDKIIENYDDGYSGNYPYDYRRSYRRDSMGRYTRGYSRDGDFAHELRELMKDAPNEEVKAKLRKLVEQVDM